MLRLTGDPVRALSINEGRGVGSTAVEHTLPNREVASLNLTGGLAFSHFNFFSGPSLKLKYPCTPYISTILFSKIAQELPSDL